MLACNHKVKDVKNFKTLDGLGNYILYVDCAIKENEAQGAPGYAAAWREIMYAAIARYDELEREAKAHERKETE